MQTGQKLTITIEATGAAFDDCADIETARILRTIADRLESSGIPQVPRDLNGNTVGTVTINFIN